MTINYGLLRNRGPWYESPSTLRNLARKAPIWRGNGVAAGGTLHAGHGNWMTEISPATQTQSQPPTMLKLDKPVIGYFPPRDVKFQAKPGRPMRSAPRGVVGNYRSVAYPQEGPYNHMMGTTPNHFPETLESHPLGVTNEPIHTSINEPQLVPHPYDDAGSGLHSTNQFTPLRIETLAAALKATLEDNITPSPTPMSVSPNNEAISPESISPKAANVPHTGPEQVVPTPGRNPSLRDEMTTSSSMYPVRPGPYKIRKRAPPRINTTMREHNPQELTPMTADVPELKHVSALDSGNAMALALRNTIGLEASMPMDEFTAPSVDPEHNIIAPLNHQLRINTSSDQPIDSTGINSSEISLKAYINRPGPKSPGTATTPNTPTNREIKQAYAQVIKSKINRKRTLAGKAVTRFQNLTELQYNRKKQRHEMGSRPTRTGKKRKIKIGRMQQVPMTSNPVTLNVHRRHGAYGVIRRRDSLTGLQQ